ncbi:uncharacterized protein LOC118459783 [Anopheles albimanus]|uniref:uncharacterized protein LOC118459783 n=1 Tax=Anopheles albimanus TaxID=7167 RepID=UPI00163FCCE1|nr:uncharacterized protein LOC118459783 [Anopheles albimanus]
MVVNACAHLYRSMNDALQGRMILNGSVVAPHAYLISTWKEIFHLHELITETLKSVVKMVSIPIAFSLAFHFTIIISEAEKTGVLLNEFLQTDIGSSVERCIELFSIELLHQDFKVNNLGLYNIDFTLMFAMIATNTSYLIMLVQFQLAEN